jgi:hypothetical protein
MPGFYRKVIAPFLGFVFLTALSAYICIEHVFISDALFPAHNNSTHKLGYDYHLTEDVTFPYVTQIIIFAEPENGENLVDLTRYYTATFRAKCVPHNVLAFYLHSFDEKVTDPANFSTYRIASALFPCGEEWSDVEIDLKHLKIPQWWLEASNIVVSDWDYRYDF